MILKLKFSCISSSSFIDNNLPFCLNGHKPSTNYHTKGLDKSCTAYFSMLQYLSGPVKNNFQSFKGHSQAINSLDVISSRKILEAIEILKIFL